MKILYISPEHVSGTLSLFQAEHRRRGDECRFVTFWHSRWDFPDDICLNLPFMPDKKWVVAVRNIATKFRPEHSRNAAPQALPVWSPSAVERQLFRLRDAFLWPRISRAIARHNLYDFDIIHLDGGLDFTRDSRFAIEMALRGKHIACFYHGSDLRNRGMIPSADAFAGLRLTCEWDLIELDPRLKYLFLPFDTSVFSERDYRFHSPVRICHASRNPYKGTSFIERAVADLAGKHSVELVLLRDMSHAEALRRMADCDIFVDQLTNEGGWGYGMSSVEAFALGLPVVTNIPERMAGHLGPHPFEQATTETIRDVLANLIVSEEKCRRLSAAGQEWVRKTHDVRSVGDQLYAYYEEAGWLKLR